MPVDLPQMQREKLTDVILRLKDILCVPTARKLRFNA